MLSAIVLHTTRYSDTGSIVHLYTEEYGRMQFVVYGNKWKGLLRPLSIIDFTSYRRNNAPSQLGTLSSVILLYTPQRLNTEVQRQCVAIFIAEMLSNTLRHPMSDPPLYNWLCSMIQHLDKDSDISNLHLHFLLEYATYLGIGIDDTDHPEWFESPSNRTIRQQRLRELTNYYEEHIEDFRPPKSLEVLIEVFN